MDRPHDGSAGVGPATRVAVAGIAIVGVVAYCIALHALLVSGAWPTLALAFVLLPWLFVIAPPLSRVFGASWAGGRRHRRAMLVGFAIATTVLAGWALVRLGAWLGARVDAVLYVENLAFFAWLARLFAASLFGDDEPFVTRMARRTRRGDMPPSVVRYTWWVTLAWALFFVASMIVSTLLFFTRPGETWSLFINVLLWPIVAGAMVLEYVVRLALLRDVKHVPFSAAIRAFRERSDDA